MILFSDRGCPFAHRVLALLDHVGLPVERHEAMIGEKPAGIEKYSTSKRIPLLVHDGLVVTESRVMLEHLAEHTAFADALPSSLTERTLHRHAMAVVDDFLAPRLFRPVGSSEGEKRRLDDALDALDAAAATMPAPRPSLLAFHVAPIWLRFRWWHPTALVTHAIEARPALGAWLDGAGALEAVVRSSPPRAEHLADIERMRRSGVVALTE